MKFSRYAIYYMPDGPLAEFGAAWLGWDPRIGKRTETLDIPDLPKDLHKLTRSARKYGLHGTLKPPFRLKTTYAEQDLIHSFEEFCADEGPAISGKIVLQAIGCQRRTKTAPNAGAKVHHLAGSGRSKSAPSCWV